MAKFYFDTKIRGHSHADTVGTSFDTAEAAMAEARVAAAEIAKDCIKRGGLPDAVDVVVRDETGQSVGSVAIREEVRLAR